MVAFSKIFNRQTLEHALTELGRRAFALGKTVELSIYDESALTLVYDWRRATKDVDAVFEADRMTIRRLAADMAAENDWDTNWLNDGVKGFLSARDRASKSLFRAYPSEAEPGLRVMLPNPRYLFAMKCRGMRIGGADASSDIADIRNLAQEIGIGSAADALALVLAFYPGRLIEPKTRFGLEELFDVPPDLKADGAGR
jgi:hypothetical protein